MRPVAGTGTICRYCGQTVDCDAPSHQLRAGVVLRGRYYIGAALGQGGFGITYIGYDMQLSRKVAVKEFYPSGFVNRYNGESSYVKTDGDADRTDFFKKGKQRFLDEARLLATFSNVEGIVDVLDCFEENNTVYIVMEYIDGITLKRYLEQNGNLSIENALQLMTPVMTALKLIHKKNLIHRDISPDNIMLTQEGNAIKVKLIDFGATRNATAVANKSLTVILKPGFAPIEQYGSWDEQGAWTDVYALCATIYKCITGVTPDASLLRLRSDRLRPPSKLGVRIGPYTEQVLLKGMSVNPSDRYRSIDELIKGFSAASSRDQAAAAQQYRQSGSAQTWTNNPQTSARHPQSGTLSRQSGTLSRQSGTLSNPKKSQRSPQSGTLNNSKKSQRSPQSGTLGSAQRSQQYPQSGALNSAQLYSGQMQTPSQYVAGNSRQRTSASQKSKKKQSSHTVAIVLSVVVICVALLTIVLFFPELFSGKKTTANTTVRSSESVTARTESETDNGSLLDVRYSHMVDFASVLGESERQSLVQKLDNVSARLQFDLAIVTTYSLGDKTITDYARDFYAQYQYGYGAEKNGAMLLICKEADEWFIFTSGTGTKALPNSVIQQIGQDMQSDFASGDFASAFATFINDCDTYVSAVKNP